MNLPLTVAGLVLILSIAALPVTARYLPPPRGRHARTGGDS
jgi:hypothetical protein